MSATPTHFDVHSSRASSACGDAALVSIGRKLTGRAGRARSCADLEAEIVANAPREEPSALRVALERELLEHPELAPGAAHALLRLDDRERAFAVSRALAGFVGTADVRAALDEAAASGSAARREAAFIALPPDAASLALARCGLDDASAAPEVRAAAAFALARGLDSLGDRDKASVLATARGIAGEAATDPHLRAESLHLIAAAASPSDGDLAAKALGDASPEVALAGARLALATGAERSQVAAALASHTDRACGVAARILTDGRSP
ncbi:MAG TPA: hypothetical protein VFF73_02225 [Planctomycetota bacterium]|nr:hypothetical protein [Planctomycetota bacterium]